MALPANAITLVVEGREEDKGDVRLEDFTYQLQKIRALLTEADKAINGRETVYYRIVDLRHQSPATVVLEPVPLEQGEDSPVFAGNVARAVLEGGRALSTGGVIPDDYYPLLPAFRAASSTVGPRVASVRLITEGFGESDFGQEITDRVNEIVGDVTREKGEVTGFLDRLNLHNSRVFYIYPNYGAKRVKCLFREPLRADVIAATGKYTTVYGTLIYQSGERHAREMVVTRLEAHPDVSELPDIMGMLGTVERKPEGGSLAW